MVPRNLILQRSDDIEVQTKPKRGEGSLHPRPKGQGIRDPPHSRSNKEKEPPRIDFSGRPLVNPTADILLGLFALHSVVTVGNEYTVYSKSGKVDHLYKLLELLGLNSESG